MAEKLPRPRLGGWPDPDVNVAPPVGLGYQSAMTDPGNAEPSEQALLAVLERLAPFGPAPLCPEIGVFQALDLQDLWDAVKALGCGPVGPPYWGVPWPAGAALARVLLDEPGRARDRVVLDVGVGGGIGAIAAAKAGARSVVAVDADPWALRVAGLAAARNGVAFRLLRCDLGASDCEEVPELILAAELEYDTRSAGARRWIDARVASGAALLAANCHRSLFSAAGVKRIATFETIPVPTAERDHRVHLLQESLFSRLQPGATHVYCDAASDAPGKRLR
jgi:predicted nicotinamide N-methyase